MYNHNGISGNQLRSPNSFSITQSAELSNKNANIKLITMVLIVKNIFGIACCHFLYLNLNNGTALSKSQKNVKPPTTIITRCEEGIF